MVPVADWLALSERDAAERIPYVVAVDETNRMHRVIVDSRLMQATRRCLLLWHRLQEHGGIHNSHADQALAREKAAWDEQKRQEIEAVRQSGSVVAAEVAVMPAAADSAAVAEAVEVAAPPSDEPWIETKRCSSCNECQNINDKLFAYNENKQAYIKDVTAGTYRQMVEAAEACQVAVIHPGKPKNPNEPGLEELLERAKPFL
jgi:ferredoxin